MFPYIRIGPIVLGTYGITMGLAFVLAWKVLEINLRRHQLTDRLAESIRPAPESGSGAPEGANILPMTLPAAPLRGGLARDDVPVRLRLAQAGEVVGTNRDSAEP